MSASLTISRPRRVLNVKALGIVIGSLLLFWLLTALLHASQVRKTSQYLRTEAAAALAADDQQKAFDLFEQYLTLNPEDPEVQENVSMLLEEHGTSRKSAVRAFRINEGLLKSDKSRNDLRLRQVRLARQLGQFSDASSYLEALRDAASDEADVWYFSGLIARDTGDVEQAEQYFRHAVTLPNASPETFADLSRLLSEDRGQPAAAFAVLNQLIVAHDDAEARRLRAAWFISQQRLSDAFTDLWLGLKYDPTHAKTTALLLSTIRDTRSADSDFNADREYQKLITHLEEVLRENPLEHRLRLYLASACWDTNQKQRAVSELRDGITLDPRQFEMQELLVDYLVTLKRIDEAEEILAGIPDGVLTRGHREFMSGRLLMADRQWASAIEAFETALGHGHNDPALGSRARVCLALCRRETGDTAAAVDAYRSLVHANPDFEGGRLGMASAYLRSNQTALAIAEYRELLHVDGVPEFLANLLIRHTLEKPLSERDWTEVEELLREDHPVVRNDVQRTLLKTDLLFAQGYPASAMRRLDLARRRMPQERKIQRAHDRLSSANTEGLHKRIMKLLEEQPDSLEGHLGLLRLLVARNDTLGIDNWIAQLRNGTAWPKLTDVQRYWLLAEAATQAAEAEQLTRGESICTTILLAVAESSWRDLAAYDNRFLLNYVRFTAAHKSVEAALQALAAFADRTPDAQQAQCLLECLRYGRQQPDLMLRINNDIVRLIQAAPADTALRVTYADARILVQQYAEAEQVLAAVIAYDQSCGPAHEQMALLQLLVHGNANSGLLYAEKAVRLTPQSSGALAIKALALAEVNRADEAITTLLQIPDDERTIASWVYEARILLAAGKTRQAADIVRDVSSRPDRRRLSPHQSELLSQLSRDLDVQPIEMTRRDR